MNSQRDAQSAWRAARAREAAAPQSKPNDAYWKRTCSSFALGTEVRAVWHSDRVGEGETTGVLVAVEETRVIIGEFAVRFEMMRSFEAR